MSCRKHSVVIAFTLFSSLNVLMGCNSSSTVALNGAGSTFVYPVMGRWIQDFQQSHPNVQINYSSIGSGGGIQQVKAGTVDFGASDAPLSDSDMAHDGPGDPDSGIGRTGMRHLQSPRAGQASATFLPMRLRESS